MKIQPCKYFCKVKESKLKVRFVALGFRQLYVIDYNEAYASVMLTTTVRAALGIATHLDFEVEQMYFVTAFLNRKLEEELFMSIPGSIISASMERKVCKLRNSLYRLK